ncbi:serine/threonine protein kinase [Streptomyces sp. PT12]|uniref:serine/threonine protein kinase n=1 Tax=Streptomyces sp. PT12 TaxID=1510197 RepID=UPI00215C0DFA|nr:serine/threonine protein kinase [Streptomyces sp. PT12]
MRQVPLPEVVEAETLDEVGRPRPSVVRGGSDRATRQPDDPVVRRAVEAAAAAARLPDHPRLDQVFDVFVQGDGLWIVSELVPARPLAAMLAEERLGPFRAAEVAADVLAALRIVHAQGWTHRNVTARTVLICEDGRAVLTGLAAGAAEEVLCGYDPLPSDVPDTFAAEPPRAPRQQGPPPMPPRSEALQRPLPGPAQGPQPEGPPPQGAETPGQLAARVREQGGLPPGFTAREPVEGPSRGEPWSSEPHGPVAPAAPSGPAGPPAPSGAGPQGGPVPDAYRRWDTGAVPRVDDRGQEQPPHAEGGDTSGFVARMRQQGGGSGPETGERLPASWDFEGGAAPERGARPPTAAERAARSGAIAAYRAGTQAGAAQRAGAGPTELPGPGRPTHPVRTGWEPTPRQAPPPQRQPPQAQHPQHPHPQHPHPQHSQHPHSQHPQQPRQSQAGPPAQPPSTVSVPVPAGAPAPSTVSIPVPGAGRGAGQGPGAEERYRGPGSARAAERARQARIATVGAVTERWAPEQAGPVYANWRLAPPVGPPADFWALGALLFRAVQGYPPYPEESAAELTQAVCAEQPAFAEDCGALRPIIESLLRQDPTERLSAEELRGWLRSLLRSAPEPEVGRRTVTAPPALEPGRPADPRRLPIVRRRGELVGPRRRPRQRGEHSPRRLGRALLTVVLLGMAGAIAYVMAFMSDNDRTDEGGSAPPGPESQEPAGRESPPAEEREPSPSGDPTEGATDPSPAEEDSEPAPPPAGFTEAQDAEGFSAMVPEGWERQGPNGDGQIVYAGEGLRLLFVPGRDSAAEFAAEPTDYQLSDQRELDPYRAYQYRSSTGLYEDYEDGVSWAQGIFDWRDDSGERTAFNRALLIDGLYHVVYVEGPADQRERLDEIYTAAAESYRP